MYARMLSFLQRPERDHPVVPSESLVARVTAEATNGTYKQQAETRAAAEATAGENITVGIQQHTEQWTGSRMIVRGITITITANDS